MSQLTPAGLTGTIHDLREETRGLMYAARLLGNDNAAEYLDDAVSLLDPEESPDPMDVLYWLVRAREALITSDMTSQAVETIMTINALVYKANGYVEAENV